MKNLRKDFPILKREINGKFLVYLDNASTTQKPNVVIDCISDYYRTYNANIHRGIHTLSQEATLAFEATRSAVKRFVNAGNDYEAIFTRGTTEAINLAARSFGEIGLKAGDNIVVSALEHHSNLIPWQQLSKTKKAELRIIPVNDDTTLDFTNLDTIIDEKTRIIAITQMSNVTGTIVRLDKIVERAKKVKAVILVDGAQGVPHLGFDLKAMDVDFLAFSAHKMLGPTGVGVLIARKSLLEIMPPVVFGGEMVKKVTQFNAIWNDSPYKFEAGTPNIADVIAFREAIDYLGRIGVELIRRHDDELMQYARKRLEGMKGVTLYGTNEKGAAGSIVSFNVDGVHAHDTGTILNSEGVAVRAGHHCCQPLMQFLQVPATVRLSFYIYNTKEEIDTAIEAISKVFSIFKI